MEKTKKCRRHYSLYREKEHLSPMGVVPTGSQQVFAGGIGYYMIYKSHASSKERKSYPEVDASRPRPVFSCCLSLVERRGEVVRYLSVDEG